MSEDPYPPIYDTDEIDDTDDTDQQESDKDSGASETKEESDIQITQIEITRDMEKWMETIQSQYDTYRDIAVREILDILSLETT